MSIDVLNIYVKIGASWSATDFIISDGIECGPVALCMFCFFSSLATPLQLIFMSDIVWYGLFPLFGQLFRFSFGNTDWNCSFNISALLLLSLCRNPILFFNGATPVHS